MINERYTQVVNQAGVKDCLTLCVLISLTCYIELVIMALISVRFVVVNSYISLEDVDLKDLWAKEPDLISYFFTDFEVKTATDNTSG